MVPARPSGHICYHGFNLVYIGSKKKLFFYKEYKTIRIDNYCKVCKTCLELFIVIAVRSEALESSSNLGVSSAQNKRSGGVCKNLYCFVLQSFEKCENYDTQITFISNSFM